MLPQGILVRGTVGLVLLALSTSGAMAQSLQVSARAVVVQAPGEGVTRTASGASSANVSAVRDSASPSPFAPPLPRREISRSKAITLGIVLGGAVGATAGYFITHDSCDMCNDSGSEALASALGAVAGAALGGFVAAQNVPPGQPQSSLVPTSTLFLSVPHPVVRYHLATFR